MFLRRWWRITVSSLVSPVVSVVTCRRCTPDLSSVASYRPSATPTYCRAGLFWINWSTGPRTASRSTSTPGQTPSQASPAHQSVNAPPAVSSPRSKISVLLQQWSKVTNKLMSYCSAEPGPPWVAAVVTFLVIAVVAAAVALAVVYRKRISNFLCPKDSLPQRFKEVCVHTSARICVRTSVTTDRSLKVKCWMCRVQTCRRVMWNVFPSSEVLMSEGIRVAWKNWEFWAKCQNVDICFWEKVRIWTWTSEF